ncbi:acyl carrier protein [Porticoccaceae bacterium]|nr:acyl carrier protein [Porticoccaceae bacterium]
MDDTNQSAVEKTVCEFISKNSAVKSNLVDVSMTLAELNVDSLEKLSIGMDLEDEYSIEFTDEEIEGFVTVTDVIKSVESGLATKPELTGPVPKELLQENTPENHHSA